MKLDPKTITRLRAVYPDIATRAIRVFNDFFTHHGRRLRVSEGFRTFTRQETLYRIGRLPPGGKTVTNAGPGESFHNYGCALDVYFEGGDPYLDDESQCDYLWKEFGKFAKGHGFVWGGDFSYLVDRPHVQLTYGLTLPEIQKLYKGGGPSRVWASFDKVRDVRIASEWEGVHTKVKLLDPKGG